MPTVLTVIIAIAVFGGLIFIHEMGHFVAARIFDVHIIEFSIGMGPKLFGKKSMKSGIDYSLRALPFGGYVMMSGEDEDNDDPRALCKKPVWQRIIVTAAGAAVNIIVGFLLTFVLVLTMSRLGGTTVAEFDEGATSADYLAVGDRIVSVDGARVYTHMDVVYEITRRGVDPVDIDVYRDGERITVKDVVFGHETQSGVIFGSVDFKLRAVEKTAGQVAIQSFAYCRLYVKQVWEGLFDLISGRYGVEAVSGPIGVTEQIGQAAKQGGSTLLSMVILISVNLGIMNLLPLPALDGGRLLFQLIELITRKKLPAEVEGKIHFVGLALLMVLMVIIAGKDIVSLFGRLRG